MGKSGGEEPIIRFVDGGSLIIAVGETSDPVWRRGFAWLIRRMKMESYCYCSSPTSGTHYSEAGNDIGRIVENVFSDVFIF